MSVDAVIRGREWECPDTSATVLARRTLAELSPTEYGALTDDDWARFVEQAIATGGRREETNGTAAEIPDVQAMADFARWWADGRSGDPAAPWPALCRRSLYGSLRAGPGSLPVPNQTVAGQFESACLRSRFLRIGRCRQQQSA